MTRFGNTPADGTGQTIAIVDAFDHPTIARALKAFDATFGLAAPPSFRKVDQRGGTHYPPADPGWSIEIALDVEWAHAIAPGASILLVEADSDQLDDLLAAVDYARRQPGVSVVSMSWGLDEFQDETLLDGYFTTPSGHAGRDVHRRLGRRRARPTGRPRRPASWPSAGPRSGPRGRRRIIAVNRRGVGSGGGISAYEKAPACQRAVQTTGRRTTPDVAYNSDPRTGFIVYDSTPGVGWIIVGGTSAARRNGPASWPSPTRAAAARVGSLRGGPADLYQLPAADFHDVAAGTNGFSAVPGYDFVTGRGTPYANLVIEDLVRWNGKAASVAGGPARPDALRAAARMMAISTVLAMPDGYATAASAVLAMPDGVTEGAAHRAKARSVPPMQGIAGSQWSLHLLLLPQVVVS